MRIVTYALVLAACGPSQARPRVPGDIRPGPRAAMLERSLAQTVSRSVRDPRCRRAVQHMLERGRREPHRCLGALNEIGAPAGRERFGVVEHRLVDLNGLRERLALAHSCRTWPLRADQSVLGPTDAALAGCNLRRFTGRIAVDVIDAKARRHRAITFVTADDDGTIELRFPEIDRALRRRGLGGLREQQRLELGEQAWAGVVDIARLRKFLAAWHWVWVTRGRGSPILYAALYPDVPWADVAEALAHEARTVHRPFSAR